MDLVQDVVVGELAADGASCDRGGEEVAGLDPHAEEGDGFDGAAHVDLAGHARDGTLDGWAHAVTVKLWRTENRHVVGGLLSTGPQIRRPFY